MLKFTKLIKSAIQNFQIKFHFEEKKFTYVRERFYNNTTYRSSKNDECYLVEKIELKVINLHTKIDK